MFFFILNKKTHEIAFLFVTAKFILLFPSLPHGSRIDKLGWEGGMIHGLSCPTASQGLRFWKGGVSAELGCLAIALVGL